MNFQKKISLKNHNTFGVEARAKYYACFDSEEKLIELLKNSLCKTEPLFILGGGSNILLTKDFEGLVLTNQIKGIKVIGEDEKYISVEVGAGEVWHDFVLWSIKENLSGSENLALIPGLVGASPMQNIGAYGAEVKEIIEDVFAVNMENGKEIIL